MFTELNKTSALTYCACVKNLLRNAGFPRISALIQPPVKAWVYNQAMCLTEWHSDGKVPMRPASTILARPCTRNYNDKWLNDTIFNSFPDKAERATMLANCSDKAVEAA